MSLSLNSLFLSLSTTLPIVGRSTYTAPAIIYTASVIDLHGVVGDRSRFYIRSRGKHGSPEALWSDMEYDMHFLASKEPLKLCHPLLLQNLLLLVIVTAMSEIFWRAAKYDPRIKEFSFLSFFIF